MALQFRIDISFTKNVQQPCGHSPDPLCVLLVAALKDFCQWSLIIPGQTDQSFRMRGQLLRHYGTGTGFGVLWYPQFHQCDQTTEILVSGAITNQQG